MKSTGLVTMQAVARAVGVATSTVSKALRGDPTIPERRRNEIKRMAERLGYRTNPLVAALMAQLHSQRRRNDPHHIAWINFWTEEVQAALGHNGSPALDGARRRARELGYEIEVHAVARDEISPGRLRQILLTRSQWGVLFPPVPESAMHYPFDLSGLTGVAIGTSLREPVMHRVSHNHYQGGSLACRELRARGFRRIGFVISPWNDERADGKWRAAYLVQQQLWPKGERLPPLVVGQDKRAVFERWLERYQPDAILAAEDFVGNWLMALKATSIRVAWLALDAFQRDVWGIDYRSELLGAAAVELVIGQMHRHERGSPPVSHSLLIDGIWVGDR
ncbi:MAG: LacI family DNA-binding transcriptional regulator [Opitutaceae bacterium]|nr:LacI family DNA-binding transcriptional regulator [Opitutaceae bacterium]